MKNLNLRIKPDGTISVSANNKIPQERINLFLTEHSDFIFNALKKYEEISKNKPEENKLITGEKIKILGIERNLIIKQGNKNNIFCNENYFIENNGKKDCELIWISTPPFF